MSERRKNLVVGGTGMLRPAVHALLADGARVIVVARRPRRAALGAPVGGELVPVAAHWRAPDELGSAVREAVDGRQLGQALLWIHHPLGPALHEAFAPLLVPTARVVQLWSSATSQPRRHLPPPKQHRPPRRYCRVVLGFVDTGHSSRWLTDSEISEAALQGLGGDDAELVVGRIEPCSQRP